MINGAKEYLFRMDMQKLLTVGEETAGHGDAIPMPKLSDASMD